MKTVSVDETIGKRHSLMNDVVTDTAAELSGGIFIVKLDDLLKGRGFLCSTKLPLRHPSLGVPAGILSPPAT